MNTVEISTKLERLGVVLEPNGDEEVEGVLNPGSTRDRKGKLILYPRCVAKGNVSRIGIAPVTHLKGDYDVDRAGFALEPEMSFELNGNGGSGCEDGRVTFMPTLDKYLMAYTAFGAQGPRIALAWSDDGLEWHRIGVCRFPAALGLSKNDKNAAFFPEPVLSPSGVRSIAFYHRPMIDTPEEGDKDKIKAILEADPSGRDSIRIAYVPLAAVLDNINNLVNVAESVQVLSPSDNWGRLKIGAGTPPVRVKEGWLSVFNAAEPIGHNGRYTLEFSSGIVIHDAEQPHKVLYRSPEPILKPETTEEVFGTVNNMVFATAIDPRPDLGERIFDVFYGMADCKVGAFRLELAD